MSATKLGESKTNNSKLLFFVINLQFVTSNQISITKFTSHKQYLFSLLTSRNEKRETQTDQSIPHVVLLWKETTYKLIKVAVAKTLFSSVYVIGITSINEYFLFYVITGRHYFS